MKKGFIAFVITTFMLASFSYADLSWSSLLQGSGGDSLPAWAGKVRDRPAPATGKPTANDPAHHGQNPPAGNTDANLGESQGHDRVDGDAPAMEEKNAAESPAGKVTVPNPDSLLALVNKSNVLPADYVPPNLIKPDVPFVNGMAQEVRYMRAEAAEALEKMFAAADQEGVHLVARSGYRSYATQKALFHRNVERRGLAAASQVSAMPGESEHQTGLVMDVTSAAVGLQLLEEFADTVEGRWVQNNAHRFGFILRYPQGRQEDTGYAFEPWHLRFVGSPAAKDIYTKDLILEEYLDATTPEGL